MQLCHRSVVGAEVDQAAIEQQLDELLGEQRVAAGAFDQDRLRLGREHGPLEQRGNQHRGLAVGERGQGHADRVAPALAPPRVPVVQLGARGAHHHERAFARVNQVLDELEHGHVCPMQVLEDQHQATLVGESLDEATPRREQLFARDVRRVGDGADERGQAPADPVALRRILDDGIDRLGELRTRLFRIVGVQDASLRLHDLPERPEAHAVAVRQASSPTPADQVGELVDERGELAEQAGLAHPRLADHGHELRRAGAGELIAVLLHLPEDHPQRRRLIRAADERRALLLPQVHADQAAGA